MVLGDLAKFQKIKIMKNIKTFFDYLFCKYYWFQIRVGNGDIAKYTPLLIIAGVLNLYLLFFFMLNNIFFDIKLPQIPKIIYFIGFFGVLSLLYMLLVYNTKYKRIINDDKNKRKSNVLAILFPLIGFLLFNIGWILKMLQNQGRI